MLLQELKPYQRILFPTPVLTRNFASNIETKVSSAVTPSCFNHSTVASNPFLKGRTLKHNYCTKPIMKFTKTDEWIKTLGDIATVGITHFAQDELGEIVHIDDLPCKGTKVKRDDVIVVLESTKATADVKSPVSGIILETNQALEETPELINQSPEGEGWIFKLKITNPKELDDLVDKRKTKSSKI